MNQTGEVCLSIDERNALAEKYLPLVRKVVRGIARCGLKTYIEVDDIVQEMSIYLMSLVQRYDPKRGASMETYLRKCIRSRALSHIKEQRRRGAPVDISTVSQRRLAIPPNQDISEIDIRSSKKYLTAEQFAVVQCCFLDGMTQARAARKIGVDQSTVARRLATAAEIIHKKFAEVA